MREGFLSSEVLYFSYDIHSSLKLVAGLISRLFREVVFHKFLAHFVAAGQTSLQIVKSGVDGRRVTVAVFDHLADHFPVGQHEHVHSFASFVHRC